MENSFIKTYKSDTICFICLARPEKKNALSQQMVTELTNAFLNAEKDKQIRIIILKANGDAFCSGADLESLIKIRELSFEQNLDDSKQMSDLLNAIYRSSKITIAIIEGPAIAGGCGLVSACDFAFATPQSRFGYPEVRIGFVPAVVAFFLIKKIGETRAKELLLTGEIILAEKALKFGLINEILDQQEIHLYAEEFANRMSNETSLNSISMTKELISKFSGKTLDEIATLSVQTNAKSRMTDDFKKGITAFLNKEKIKW